MEGQHTNSKKLQWQLECLGHTLTELLAGLLPGPWIFRIGETLAGITWHFMPKRRKTVIRNLRIALAGEKSLEEIEALAKASFRRTGGNLLSAAYTARLSPEKLNRVMEIENPELAQETLARGKGVVLMLSHMGNWELLARLVHLLPKGTKTGAFYRPLNNEILDDRILARRQTDGTRMFSKRDPFHQVTSFLRDGGIVGILADQRVGVQGDLVHFFGRTTRASPLPSLLARRAKSEILALSLETVRPGKWKVRFHQVEQPINSESCMNALQKAMSNSLIDVFWLQERWKIYFQDESGFDEWLGHHPAGEKKHRVLLWIDSSSESEIPSQWIHPDVTYEIIAPAGTTLPAGLPSETIVHILPNLGHIEDIRATILRIDRQHILPLDLIVCHRPNAELTQACKQELIPVIALS